jgi:hypothetical protein
VLAAGAVVLSAAPAAAYDAPGPRWPGSTIRFHETLPKSYDWSLRRAVATWNTSGARLRLREVKSRSRAQVSVGFGDTFGYGGYATVGRQPGAYVRLSGRGRLDPDSRVMTGAVIAHEFGHVLGLDHVESRGCRLMEPVIESRCIDAPPGYYRCRWLSEDDVRGAVRLYGGSVKKLSRKYCLLEPKPPRLAGVRVAGGPHPQVPVTVEWEPSRTARKGSFVVVAVYAASRCSGDERALQYGRGNVRPRVGTWTAPLGQFPPGDYCVEVRVVNRYGLEGPETRVPLALTRAPTPAPVIGEFAEYPEPYTDYLVRVDLPADTYLEVAASASGRCATSLDRAQLVSAYQQGEGLWALYGVPPGPSCLSFFAVANDGGTSTPVTREVVHGTPPQL